MTSLTEKLLEAMDHFELRTGQKIEMIRMTSDQYHELRKENSDHLVKKTKTQIPKFNEANIDVCEPVPTIDCREMYREELGYGDG